MKVLFIGNSSTYFHDIPKTMIQMAASMGNEMITDQITLGGCFLHRYADPLDQEAGVPAREKIAAGHDIVFLQDNGNCIADEEAKEKSRAACRTLHELIEKTGAKTYLYIRAPYGYDVHNLTPKEHGEALTALFGDLGKELHAPCAHAAKAYAICREKHPEINLFWTDNAHTSVEGAYLSACCCYHALYGNLPDEVFEGDIPHETALILKSIAREAMA